jgi:hypothetical protein
MTTQPPDSPLVEQLRAKAREIAEKIAADARMRLVARA